MIINEKSLHFHTLNAKIVEGEAEIRIEGCNGQRYICSGMRGKTVDIFGTPGNAPGAYPDGTFYMLKPNAKNPYQSLYTAN